MVILWAVPISPKTGMECHFSSEFVEQMTSGLVQMGCEARLPSSSKVPFEPGGWDLSATCRWLNENPASFSNVANNSNNLLSELNCL